MSDAQPAGDEDAGGASMTASPQLTHVAIEWKHDSPLIACRFDPTGRYVFITAEDRTIQRFDLADGKKVALAGHESWVRDLAFMPDGQTMISCDYAGKLIWWPAAAEQPEPIRTVEAHQGWIRSVHASPDGQWLASGGNDHMVRIWDPADGGLVRELSGHDSHLYCVRFHPDGAFLLSGDLSGWVRQWDPITGSEVRRFDATALHTYHGGQRVHYGGVRGMSVSADRRYLACSGLHKALNPFANGNEMLVLLFEWDSQELLRQMVVNEHKQGVVWQVAFHPDGFLIGGGGAFLLFWKPDQDNVFFAAQLPDVVREMDMHPDGLRLATAHSDGHVRISRMAAKEG